MEAGGRVRKGEEGKVFRDVCRTSRNAEENSHSLGYERGESGDVGDLDTVQVALDLWDTTPCCHRLMETKGILYRL
jgi:hypothetical protein